MSAHPTQQKTLWGNRPVDSQDAVIEGLNHLGLPTISRKNLSMLSSSKERDKFKNAIETCLQISGNNEAAKETKRYLFGLASCISDEMQTRLGRLGYQNVPFEIMMHIGINNGIAFDSALKAAHNQNVPTHEQGISFVETTLQEASEFVGWPSPLKTANPANVTTLNRCQSDAVMVNNENAKHPNVNEGETSNGYLSTHVYGSKSALCFNASKSKNKENFTVSVDAALASGERQYDWKNAITIQLGHKELPLLYAVLVGWQNTVKFEAHGSANDKCFEIKRQEGKFYTTINAKGFSTRAVPISVQDTFPIIMLVLSQIVKQAPPELRGHPDIIIHHLKVSLTINPVIA